MACITADAFYGKTNLPSQSRLINNDHLGLHSFVFLLAFFRFHAFGYIFYQRIIVFEEAGSKLFSPLIMGSISSKTFTKYSKKIPACW
jgi:hypothetical protein